MQIVWFLLVGLVAGWLAGLVMKTPRSGLLKNLVIGVLGAVIGGWLFPMLGLWSVGLVGNILIATGGAIVLIWLIRALS